MSRKGGNPDFGSKYKFDYGRKKPLSEQIKAAVYPETKKRLQQIAQEKECSVPDIIREAIDQYLDSYQ